MYLGPTRRRAAALALAALTLGCTGEPTEIVVIVSSDLDVPAELDAIQIQVAPPAGAPSQTSTARLGPGEPSLPRSLGLVHESGPLGPYDVRVTGLSRGAEVVERRGELTFIPREIRVWRVTLSRACVGTRCPSGETCEDGACRSVVVSPGELGQLTPGDVDAGPGGCVPTGDEACDGRDNDCDGEMDEGFDLDSDPAHCGRCGDACVFTNADGACRGGACEIDRCDEGFEDCNADGSDGCEAALGSDLHCSRCGDACRFANAAGSCAAGACVMGACEAGFDDCNMSDADGCEVDIRTVAACGSCANTCTVMDGTPRCMGGDTCAVASCDDAFADCNASYADGCETDTDTDPEHCGACGEVCLAPDICQGGDCCAPGCPFCDATCVSGTPCVCTPGCGCTLDCDAASGCDTQCDGSGTTCDIDQRDTSNGDGRCAGGAACTVDGRDSSNLTFLCDGAGTSCEVDCSGGSNCTVDCTSGAACRIDCTGASNCDIDTCPTGVMNCGGGNVKVCNRTC